jgi:hypothetical protein
LVNKRQSLTTRLTPVPFLPANAFHPQFNLKESWQSPRPFWLQAIFLEKAGVIVQESRFSQRLVLMGTPITRMVRDTYGRTDHT